MDICQAGAPAAQPWHWRPLEEMRRRAAAVLNGCWTVAYNAVVLGGLFSVTGCRRRWRGSGRQAAEAACRTAGSQTARPPAPETNNCEQTFQMVLATFVAAGRAAGSGTAHPPAHQTLPAVTAQAAAAPYNRTLVRSDVPHSAVRMMLSATSASDRTRKCSCRYLLCGRVWQDHLLVHLRVSGHAAWHFQLGRREACRQQVPGRVVDERAYHLHG